MNPFELMATTLAAKAYTGAPAHDPIPPGLCRTERIRRLLKATARPMTAEEIAWDMEEEFPNFGVHLVWLLLKYDIQKGRVLLERGRYSWSVEWDTIEAQQIRSAIKLLRHAGYSVRKNA